MLYMLHTDSLHWKASHSASSIQFLIPSPAFERVILNFQFKGVPWCLCERQHLYFCIKWWQCFQVLVVWNQAWNTGTLEFHHSKNPGIFHLPKCWYNIKFPLHTPVLALSNHFLSCLVNLCVETRAITAKSCGYAVWFIQHAYRVRTCAHVHRKSMQCSKCPVILNGFFH